MISGNKWKNARWERKEVRKACAAMVALLWMFAVGHASAGDIKSLDAASLRAAQQAGAPLVVIDVGGRPSYDRVHVDGAVNIPAATLSPASLTPGFKTVVYDSGFGTRRARQAAVSLLNAGFSDVSLLAGGIAAWVAAGFQTRGMESLDTVLLDAAVSSQRLAEAIQDGDDFLLVDVRGYAAYAEGHISGAVHVYAPEVPKASAGWDRGKWVVVYGGGQGSAPDVVRELRRGGLRFSAYLKGGYPAWLAQSAGP